MKFDIEMVVTLHSSIDNVSYYEISDKTHNLKIAGGESLSLEESELGVGFIARYIKIILDQVKKVDYSEKKDTAGNVIQTGVWPVAITEISAYDDIILKSESTLIRTTTLTSAIDIDELAGSGETYTINVGDTTGFDSTGTAYIEGDLFIYTGITGTSFTGCTGLNTDHPAEHRVTASLEGDTSIYDNENLLGKIGDRVYKKIKVDSTNLFTQEDLDRVTKAYLREFYKDHSKIAVTNVFSPFIQVGQTIRVEDPYNNTNLNYFVESVNDSQGNYQLVLARYPE